MWSVFICRVAPLVALALVVTGACTPPPASSEPGEVIYRGARLLLGDGSAPLEEGAFAVLDGRITRVGLANIVAPDQTAPIVDLTGKTVMPAMVDAHAHIGYMRDLTSGPANYTRENILDHMRRYAWFGVAAGMAMGSDFGDLPYAVRDETAAGRPPDAARFLTAGRGLAPPDEVRPDNMRHSAYSIATPQEARTAVRELKARGVTIVKTWVDDRGGRVRKMPPEVYGAIIDEAHANDMRVMVHATGLDDAKALVRRGVDGFGHAFLEVDDELVALVKQRPDVFYLFALGGPRRLVHAPWLDPIHPLVAATVSPAQIERLRQRLAAQSDAERAAARRAWDSMAAGIARLAAAGARIGVGTDGGGQTGDQFVGWTVHTEVENMVAAGMTPAEVLKAATSAAAGIVGLTDVGRLAPGYSADFVVLDANPLDDITNTRRIAHVFLRGVEIDRAALQREWTRGTSTAP
jgi:imidazolonepropionase-like amidohydrolase